VPTSTSPLDVAVVRPLLLDRARVRVEVLRVLLRRGALDATRRVGSLAVLRGLGAAVAAVPGCSGLGVVSRAVVLSSR
jgi:hypothetical protein